MSRQFFDLTQQPPPDLATEMNNLTQAIEENTALLIGLIIRGGNRRNENV